MEKEQRTPKQNNSLHRFCENVAEALNAAGYDVRAVLERFKGGVDIPWNMMSCKDIIWRSVQKGVYKKESTTELDKIKEINEIVKIINNRLLTPLGIEYIPFPHTCNENCPSDCQTP